MSAATKAASREAPHQSNDERFLSAWIEAVNLIGPRMFGCQARMPSTAAHWHQLTPRLETMRKNVPNASKREVTFMSAVASFYNATEGEKLLKKADANFGDMAILFTSRQRYILAELLTHYRGW